MMMETSSTVSPAKPQYTVDVHGFSQTERIILKSIFSLSARRAPKFVEFMPTMDSMPDVFLVDAEDANAIADFRQKNAMNTRPAILIGDTNHGISCTTLSRPLQWTKMFKAFDLAVGINTPSPIPKPELSVRIAAPYEKTQPMVALMPTLRSSAPPITPPQLSNTTTLKSNPVNQKLADNLTLANPPDRPFNWVLVCDDNMTVREFMRAKLAPFGFNVDYAETGEQAVGLTGTKHYACVFLDVVMPGINGYQVCKLIKSKKSAAKTAVVMLSSKDSTFDKIRATMSGCDTYLTKPVNENRLFEVISKYLPTNA
ncbi:MAG: response regulator [Candidatus Nitrotoga sp.]|nr:response regulator [Candidatus Nitrotoga sp.]MDO9446355.1 response regulator [Candidatus Nitrotoga sp.]MDP3497009.1 response regulator [Candidatus Nitrotoga sp.]RFC40759.1 MAG: Response regulator receiver domain-containing protein [Candidatus Nitrotoga sp. CP45]